MQRIIALLFAAVAATIVIMFKQIELISVEDARKHLAEGAMVIDVRNPDEFRSGHLKAAINIPLDTVEVSVPPRVKDKGKVLLLHCAAGVRSGMAREILRSLGYANAFNLGSYDRARDIVENAAEE